MRAIEVTKPGELRIVDREPPREPQAGHVVVGIRAMGLCGSDIHILHGQNPFATYPRIIGHEAAGEVLAVASDVTAVSPGDRVVVDPVISCGECPACRIGRQNVCSRLQVRGVHTDGMAREQLLLPASCLHVFRKDLPFETAVLCEPFTIAAETLWRGRVTGADTLLLFGAGPIGQVILQGARRLGAKVLVTDVVPERLDLAKCMGASDSFDSSKEGLREWVRSSTDGVGPSVTVDAVGRADIFELAVEMAAPAGRIVVLGFGPEPSRIAERSITARELDILGSRLHNNKFPEALGWIERGEVNPRALVSHTFRMEEVEKAIDLIEHAPRETCKVILTF